MLKEVRVEILRNAAGSLVLSVYYGNECWARHTASSKPRVVAMLLESMRPTLVDGQWLCWPPRVEDEVFGALARILNHGRL